MNVTINRHKWANHIRGDIPHPGDLIETWDWAVDALPRVGDLVTCHPEIVPNARSFTGRVSGVQHVLGRGQRIVVTVVDERITERDGNTLDENPPPPLPPRPAEPTRLEDTGHRHPFGSDYREHRPDCGRRDAHDPPRECAVD